MAFFEDARPMRGHMTITLLEAVIAAIGAGAQIDSPVSHPPKLGWDAVTSALTEEATRLIR